MSCAFSKAGLVEGSIESAGVPARRSARWLKISGSMLGAFF